MPAIEPAIKGQTQRTFTSDDRETWKLILSEHSTTRGDQVIDLFEKGIAALGMNSEEISSLEQVNEKLKAATGWQGLFVEGLEDAYSFYKLLSQRYFPVGNFIRDKQDLNYTPAPDIVHDMYGHLPFFVDPDYADFCQKFGEAACRFMDREDLLRQMERFFWFTVEFGLIKTPEGNRVFGAGIASSIGECAYALSGEPEVLPFDIDTIRYQEFRIDQMQKRLFLLDSKQQLYSSLPELVRRVEADRDKKENGND